MGIPRYTPPRSRQHLKPGGVNTLFKALKRASALSRAEVAETMAPYRACFARLREGVATEDQHTVLATAMHIAQAIEQRGIVRGLHEHITSAQQALAAVRTRALATGTWRQTALHYYELEAITTALDLHEFQIQQLSAGEIHDIARKLIAQTQTNGGTVKRASPQSIGLQAA